MTSIREFLHASRTASAVLFSPILVITASMAVCWDVKLVSLVFTLVDKFVKFVFVVTKFVVKVANVVLFVVTLFDKLVKFVFVVPKLVVKLANVFLFVFTNDIRVSVTSLFRLVAVIDPVVKLVLKPSTLS